MAEYIGREKIKTCFAQIIVNNSEDKPYYSIMYWENGEMNIGFSSYNLDYVRRWLNEKFEVKRNVNVVPVMRCKDCKWIESANFDTGFWVCSKCGFVSEAIAAHKLYGYCPNCGAKMDGGAE